MYRPEVLKGPMGVCNKIAILSYGPSTLQKRSYNIWRRVLIMTSFDVLHGKLYFLKDTSNYL